MRPPDAPRPPRQTHRAGGQDITDTTSAAPHFSGRGAGGSPTLAYLAGRERVLGARVSLPDDPAGAADVLARLHGGERRAAHWLRQVLAEVGG